MPRITINGRSCDVLPGTSVAAAVMNIGVHTRTSISGQPRNPLCGMGICFECRLTIDGVTHERSCQITVREGMEVSTGAL